MKLARMLASDETPEDLPAVMRGLPPRFPLAFLRRTYLAAAYRWYGLRDG
jgi:hypothetical protein